MDHLCLLCCCWAGRSGSGQGRAGLSSNLIDQGQKVEVTSAARRRRSKGSGLYVDVGGGCGFGGRGLLLRTLAALGCPKTLHHRPEVAPPAAEGCAQTSNLSQVCRRTLCTAHRSPGFHSTFHTIVTVVATGLNSTALPLLSALSSTPGHRNLQLTSYHREPSTSFLRSTDEGRSGIQTWHAERCILSSEREPPWKMCTNRVVSFGDGQCFVVLTLVVACGGEVEESPASKTLLPPSHGFNLGDAFHQFHPQLCGQMGANARLRGGNFHGIFGVRWQNSLLDQIRCTRPSPATFSANRARR